MKTWYTKTFKSLLLVFVLALVAVATSSAVAQTRVNKIFKIDGNNTTAENRPDIDVFRLKPLQINEVLNSNISNTSFDEKYKINESGGGSSISNSERANFVLAGTGIFDNLIVHNGASGDEASNLSFVSTLNPTTKFTKLFVNYLEPDSSAKNTDTVTNYADLQVDGTIRATDLAHTATGSKKLCANDFGVLVTEPNTGDCEDSSTNSVVTAVCESWTGDYKDQPAINNGTGCKAGTYADDTSDSSGGVWKWNCMGSDSSSTSDDVACTANKIIPVCKGYVGTYYNNQPATNLATGCITGTSYSDSGVSDTSSQWRWQCIGSSAVTCTAQRSPVTQTWSGTGCGSCPFGTSNLPEWGLDLNFMLSIYGSGVEMETGDKSWQSTRNVRKAIVHYCTLPTNLSALNDVDGIYVENGVGTMSIIDDSDDIPICALSVDEAYPGGILGHRDSFKWGVYDFSWGITE